MKLKENDLLYTLKCDRCKGRVAFEASVSRKDAVIKLLLNHDWTEDGKRLLCDGCSGMMKEDKPKAKPKRQAIEPKDEPKPIEQEVEDDDDDYVYL